MGKLAERRLRNDRATERQLTSPIVPCVAAPSSQPRSPSASEYTPSDNEHQSDGEIEDNAPPKRKRLPSPAVNLEAHKRRNVDNFQTNGNVQLPDGSRLLTTTLEDLAKDTCLCGKEPRIPRPRNAFILYRQAHQAEIATRYPGEKNPGISTIIGAQWQAEPEHIKDYWKELAEVEKKQHAERFPNYKYEPRRNGAANSAKTPTSVGKQGQSSEQTSSGRCLKCGKRTLSTPRTPALSSATAGESSAPPKDALTATSATYSAGLPSYGELESRVNRTATEYAISQSADRHGPERAAASQADFSQPQMPEDGKHSPVTAWSYPPPTPDGQGYPPLFSPGSFYGPSTNGHAPTPRLPPLPFAHYSVPASPYGPSPLMSHANYPSHVPHLYGGHAYSPFHPPPPPWWSGRPLTHDDRDLRLAPLQIPSAGSSESNDYSGRRDSLPGHESSGVTAGAVASARSQVAQTMTMDQEFNFLEKLRILERIHPPMSSTHVRGYVIAVESQDPALAKVVGLELQQLLNREPQYRVSTWVAERRTNLRSADDRHRTLSSIDRAGLLDEYMEVIGSWRQMSKDVVRHVTQGGSASDKGKDPQLKMPIALMTNGFSFTLTEGYATAIPITDAYMPRDHWQWLATMWRGIAGADLIVYVRSAARRSHESDDVQIEAKSGGLIVVTLPNDGRERLNFGSKGFDEQGKDELGLAVRQWLQRDVCTARSQDSARF